MEKVDSFFVFWLKELRLYIVGALSIAFLLYADASKYDNVDYIANIDSQYLSEQDAIAITKKSLLSMMTSQDTLNRMGMKGHVVDVFGENPSRDMITEVSKASPGKVRAFVRRGRDKYLEVNIDTIRALDASSAKVFGRKGKFKYVISLSKSGETWNANSVSFSITPDAWK